MSRWGAFLSVFASSCVACAWLGCGPNQVSLPSPVSPLVATPDEAFRREPPSPSPRRAFRLPLIVEQRLDNGLSVILIPRPGSPSATVRYVTRSGGEDGSQALAGRAWFVGSLIKRTIADAPDDSALSLVLNSQIDVGYDSASLSLHVTSDRVAEAISMIAQAVQSPSFEPSRIDDVRQKTLEMARWFGRSPERTALIRARGMLYGYDHRAALPLWGSVERIRRVTRAELMALHHMTWGPRESALVIVGDLDPARCHELAVQAFDGWETERPPQRDGARWIALDSSDVARALGVESRSPRSLVLLMEQAPPRRSRDRLPFKLLSMILGGMSSSQMNTTLREDMEGARGAFASYEERLAGGELVLTARVGRRGRDIAAAVNTMDEEIDRMLREGPTERELERARSLVREQTLSAFEQSDSAALLLADAFALGIGPSHLERFDEELESITPDRVREAARRWLRPERAPLVVTGDLNAISFAFDLAEVGPSVVRP